MGLVAATLVAGCSQEPATAAKPTVPPIRFGGKVEVPTALAPTDLALLSDEGRLRVGDSMDDASRVFPSPERAFGLKDLPPGFGSGFRARGYESAQDGLGLILVDNRVALAVRRLENVSFDAAQSAAKRFITEFGEAEESVSGARIDYRFWTKEDQRLMVCTAPDRTDPTRFDVTMAVGTAKIMDALRMSYPSAREDRAMAERVMPGLRHPG